jgi:hypothetical protein
MGLIEIPVIGLDYNLITFVDEEDYRTFELSGRKFHRIIGRNTTYAASWSVKRHADDLLHRIIMGLLDSPSDIMVDHIDGNGLNNSRTNLRLTDNSTNMMNSKKSLSGNQSSSYKGVCYNFKYNNEKPWRACIYLPDVKKQKFLGNYRTEYEAAIAYDEAALQLFGEFANPNFP